MAGLELLYNSVASSISCPQDVLVCFVHWEIVRRGYKCLGVGDEPQTSDKKSELLPQGWNGNKELYTLRYQSSDDKSRLLVKAITVDSSLIFNLMNTEELKTKVQTGLLSQMFKQKTESKKKVEKSERERTPDWGPDHDPLRIPPRRPLAGRDPSWPDPMAPFAAGRADLDPLSGQPGGMIMDPLRSGFPRSGFDPSAGIPGRLPPGAVPPGARFDPFGPIGQNRPGPDPDHMPPPGYDDMFM
ncbi:proteasome inhibitor PI31 subunit-like [Scleropages formosus]|uniref:Proteasome inhibitor PI31 subunit n=1 Tax=Scleropages formosus TaxID=113540 RepID=A0A0P7UL68_SCLFO|nr:proteasome inhibitor PI31 subunit-like [Scleropages formosus]